MSRKSIGTVLIIVIAIACGITSLWMFLPDGDVDTPPPPPQATTGPVVTSTPTAGAAVPTRPGGGVAPTAGR